MKKLKRLDLKEGWIFIDDDCKYCNEAIEQLQGNKMKYGEVFMMYPDFNSAGVITHYHLEIVSHDRLSDFSDLIERGLSKRD